MATTITILNNALDAGDVKDATGYNAATRGDDITIMADLTPGQITTVTAQLQAYVPLPAAKPGAIRTAVVAVANATNGTDITTLTAAQVRMLLGVMLATQGWVKLANGKYVVNIQ